ncbi:hypothetical protein FA95DRAFT_1559415 [Auriscalpium vulgare]|uniref:Uncharacterized protein n=1 Tax=Auriscalpium vulgare TaxID=40419 RepID=A0ACB8RTI4_9AGAM|nr:hypothetical protein FA95DRAFT_1559415 [Auriscalpium vulgare]
MSAAAALALSTHPRNSSTTAVGQFDSVLAASTKYAAQYESQIKELEDRLSEGLSNCRAIEGQLREAVNGIKRNYRRADRDALRTHIPHMSRELEESMAVLTELEQRLPEIHSQVAQIRLVYDSGRRKAEELVQDLKWLNNDFYERWRATIFTTKSPVSWRWKFIMRVLFTACFLLAAWIAWIAMRGAYRAHRQRLVWGERLMS